MMEMTLTTRFHPGTSLPSTEGATFTERAFDQGWYKWEATRYACHIAVKVGRHGDRFAKASAPFHGDPSRCADFADYLARVHL